MLNLLLQIFRDKEDCLSSKRIALLVFVVFLVPILFWVIDFLMSFNQYELITKIVSALIWATAAMAGAVASERFRR